MSLDPLHEQIARLAFGLPEAEQVALAGGGAMLAHNLVARPTHDVDLFTPQVEEVTRLTDALAAALRETGAQVDTTHRGPGFARLAVRMRDGRSVAVDIGHDARIREAVQLAVGPVLHPDELAADKTLALFGRAAARDLVDVMALTRWYGLEQLCQLAAEKDPGFDRGVFADALRAASAHPDAAFADLALAPAATAAVRAKVTHWRDALLAAPSGEDAGSADRSGHGPEADHQQRSMAPDWSRWSGDQSGPWADRHRDGPESSL